MERINRPTADVIDLADIFRSIRNGWLTIAGFTLLGLFLSVAVLVLVPPTFVGKASVLLKTGGAGAGSSLASAIGSFADAAGAGAGGAIPVVTSAVETEVEILQSRVLAGDVVDSLALQARILKPRATPALRVFSDLDFPGSFEKRTYAFSPIGSGAEPRRYRFVAEGDSGIATVGTPANLAIGRVTLAPTAPARNFKASFMDREDATTDLADNLDFDKSKTDIAHFAYHGDDSISAARVPNLLIDLYLFRRKGVDRGLNQKTAEFLAGKVDSVGTALAAAERALRAQREASGLVHPVMGGVAEFENENLLRQQLLDVQMQERTLQQLVAKILDGSASPVQLASYPQYLQSSPISTIITSLITVETEKQALLGTVTEQDERVKALTTRAKELEGRIMPLAQASLTALASQRSSIEQRLQTIEQSLVGKPRAAEAYGRLERDVLDLGKILAGLQVKLVDARLNAITEGGDVRALDVAVPSKKPEFPKKVPTIAAGLGGGVFFGLVVAILLGLVGGRMHDAQDVERRMGLPAVRLETAAPLLVGGPASRTILVAPIDRRALAKPVAERLVETALSRSITATVLDLSNAKILGNGTARLITASSDTEPRFDANAAIRRLEETHDLVVVQLPALTSHEAAAVLDGARPVLLVAPERRIERDSLQNAVDMLRRVGAPCAGVVLHGDDRRSLRA